MNWRVSIVEVGVIPQLPLSLYMPDVAPDALIDPACYCYLASDGVQTVIIDTGPDRTRSRAEGLEIVGDTEELLARGLRASGVEPAEVTAIVHTHLHYDHMQNDRMFPTADVFVQEREVEWATGPARDRFYVGVPELLSSLGDRLNVLDGDTELFPGLRVVLNGGHTPGHQSVLVDTIEGVACLCGDIVSLFENVNVVGPICTNVPQTMAFLDRARAAGWEMVPSHDPKLREHRWYIRPRVDKAAQPPRTKTKGNDHR